MNTKAIGGGALLVLGVGGFLVYNWYEEKKEKDRAAAEQAKYNARETEKAADEASRVKEAKWGTIPDVYGKTESEAKKLLTEAGFNDDSLEILADTFGCEYDVTVDDQSDMVPTDAICQQDRKAGTRVRAESFKLKVVIEHDTFEHGGLTTSEWRRMPDVVNMTVADAQALLATKGFGADEFEVVDSRGGCETGKICESVPPAGQRKHKDRPGSLLISR
jgi:beta-lactam-binding protein with PASTA domain